MEDRCGNLYYLYRYTNGMVHFVSKSEIPHALSNISQNAAQFRFELEQAQNSAAALNVVMRHATYAINAERL